MRSSFGNTLRHLSDGTRLYGREHQGQGLAVFLLCLYLPLVIPLLRNGVWVDPTVWIEEVRVPTPGLLLAAYSVVVAVVIALALTPPSAVAATESTPYPVQRPVKTKIIQNCRIFLNAMIALGVVGLIFTSGIDRWEHLLGLVVGTLLLQLGHLDEVNSVQVESVLLMLGKDPLVDYDRWFARRWTIERTALEAPEWTKVVRKNLVLVILWVSVQAVALISYILLVHGANGLFIHALSIILLSVAAGLTSVVGLSSVLASTVVSRHATSRRSTSFSIHPESYFAALLVLAKIITVLVMAMLPFSWLSEQTRIETLIYVGFLILEMLLFFSASLWLLRRWGKKEPQGFATSNAIDAQAVRHLLKKKSAKDRASIRGAVIYRQRFNKALKTDAA